MIQDRSWLMALGEHEIALSKRLGHDHPKTLGARRRFHEAYISVQKIRDAFNLPACTKKG